MHDSSPNRWIAFIGRAAVALAMWAVTPLELSESFADFETIATAQVGSSHVVEPSRQCVRLGKLHYRSHTPEQSPGLTTFLGHDGRRISADLLAPLRC